VDTYGDAGLGLLGDPTRRAIFELLAQGPCSVGALAERLPISRSAVSQHLRRLKDGGLVVSHSQGTRRIYRVNPDGVIALRSYLDRTAFPWPPMRPSTPQAADLTTAPAIPALSGSIIVGASAEHAFRVFIGSFNTWWPHQFHIGQADMAGAILESRVGGRWYERGEDGSECDWGRVLVLEPPHRLVVTWQINGQWQYDPDPEHASEIEVRFTADGPGQTTVELEHRYLHRLIGGQTVYEALIGGGSWIVILERFARTAVNEK
jgi:DNA-binding transcriptional ArsR family regulator/uncharacterized protein YndB with AHSA1/START domain